MRSQLSSSVASLRSPGHPCRTSVFPLGTGAWRLTRGFTLTEMLVVLAVIILMLGAAIPAFNLITGTKSTQAAENLIGAAIGRARTYAISHQRTAGVVFFLDPTSQRTTMGLVVEDQPGPTQGSTPYLQYDAGGAAINRHYIEAGGAGRAYLDLVPDEDLQSLPPGVGCQLIHNYIFVPNPAVPNAARAFDRYVRTGAILFDAEGRLISREIGFDWNTALGQMMGLKNPSSGDPGLTTIPVTLPYSFRSQLGLVLYDVATFRNLGFTEKLNEDSIINPNDHDYSKEEKEEIWLDENASQLLISRYSGAILRGE